MIRYTHIWNLTCKVISAIVIMPFIIIFGAWFLPIFEKYQTQWHLPEILFLIPMICVMLPLIFLIGITPLKSKLPTYLYIRLSLNASIKWKDVKRYECLFEVNKSGKWHPLADISYIPKEYRIMVLDEILASFDDISRKSIGFPRLKSENFNTDSLYDELNLLLKDEYTKFDKAIPIVRSHNRIRRAIPEDKIAISKMILNLSAECDTNIIKKSYIQLHDRMVSSSEDINDPIIQAFILCRIDELDDAFKTLLPTNSTNWGNTSDGRN